MSWQYYVDLIYFVGTQYKLVVYPSSKNCSGYSIELAVMTGTCVGSNYTKFVYSTSTGSASSPVSSPVTSPVTPPVSSSSTTSSSSSEPKGCFAGSETLHLESGEVRAISDVRVGDRVLAADAA